MHPNTIQIIIYSNTMKMGATGIRHVSSSNPINSNLLAPQKNQFTGGSTRFWSSNNNLMKMTNTNSSSSKSSNNNSVNHVSYTPKSKWMELQGINNWDGLLDPLDNALRDEILRYGQFVEAAYRCFDFDTSSPSYATCRLPKASILPSASHHRVTRFLHATCGVHLPAWAGADRWASPRRSSWIGYVAVCDDPAEIARLGRRDVVIAYRGTATPMEWAENMRVTLAGLPASMARDQKSMVQSGVLSLYTSSDGTRDSLQESIREEVGKIVAKYDKEPLSITVTGHSLGAALATITAHDISTTFDHLLVTVVSFGGPRVGNKHFRSQLERGGTKVLRIVNSEDPVTKVPGFVVNGNGGGSKLMRWIEEREWWVYAEIGEELRLSSSRDCPDLTNKGGVATCHDLKTYLHLVDHFVSSNCPLRATAKRVFCAGQAN